MSGGTERAGPSGVAGASVSEQLLDGSKFAIAHSVFDPAISAYLSEPATSAAGQEAGKSSHASNAAAIACWSADVPVATDTPEVSTVVVLDVGWGFDDEVAVPPTTRTAAGTVG